MAYQQNHTHFLRFTLASALIVLGTTLSGCGALQDGRGGSNLGGAGSSTSSGVAGPSASAQTAGGYDIEQPSEGEAGALTLTGTITYQRILARTNITTANSTVGNATLDFKAPVTTPCRYVIVQALDEEDKEVAHTNTDDTGNYSLSVPGGTGSIKVRVRAETVQKGTESAPILVQDNTKGGAAYMTESELMDRDISPPIVNFDIPSGYDTGGKSAAVRPSGAFAALDGILTGYQFFLNAGLDASKLPKVVVNWSIRNTTTEPDADKKIGPPQGAIGTSHFSSSTNSMFLLGDVSSDTDEYDWHICVHEFGHWMQYNRFRDDSPGDSHGNGEIKDARLVMSEGYGNALGALALNDPIYKDTDNADGAAHNFELYMAEDKNPGWFSEASWTDILWHLFAPTSTDYPNRLGLPLSKFFAAMDYQTKSAALTTPFSFMAGLTANNVSASTLTPALANVTRDAHFGWNSLDAFGVGETHDGGITAPTFPSSLPLYVNITTNTSLASPFNLTIPAQPDVKDGEFSKVTNWLQGNRYYFFAGDGQHLAITVENSSSTVGSIAMSVYGGGRKLKAEEKPDTAKTDETYALNTTSGTVYVLVFTNYAATGARTNLTNNTSTTTIKFSH